jgi:general secretion pathway protein D
LKNHPAFLRLCAVSVLLLLGGCATNVALQESRTLLSEGRIDESVARLELAMKEAPFDKELRAEYFRQRDAAAGQLLAAAENERAARHFEAAQALYRRVQKFDANNPRVREGLADLSAQQRHEAAVLLAQTLLEKGEPAAAERLLRNVLAENPGHAEARRLVLKLREASARAEPPPLALKDSFRVPITLEFRDTPLKTVFEVIARTSGLNFVFDRDVRADTKVTIFVRDTSIEDLVKLILTTNGLERKLLNENSILIYPNTPAKAKDYLELVTRSFYLANADVKQAQTLVRSLVKTKDIFIDEKLNLLVMKDTPEAVQMAERLLESLDMAEPEVMLDVEVLEISRNKLLELGLRFPDQIGYGLLTPSSSSTIVNGGVTQSSTVLGGTLAAGNVDLRDTSALTSYVSNPALLLNLKNQVGSGNTLANPRIRVRNREKAKIHIGDKLPVFTTTSTANVGVAASVAFLDVGLKLDVEPNVYLDDEVAIKVGLEVSSIGKEITGPGGSLAYQIGTRSASTVLRLKNGETQVLAGLISDEERSSANRLPGLGDIPVLGRLFSSQRDDTSKTEIILLITPRIVRNLIQPEGVGQSVAAGSDSAVGAPAFKLKKAPPRSLSLSSKGGGASGGSRAAADAPAADTSFDPAGEPQPDFTPTPPPEPVAPAPVVAAPATENSAAAPAAPPGLTSAPPSSVTLQPLRK